MSNTKLGLAVFWPSFWTAFPFKLAIGLLLLAAGLHPWEGTGLLFLLVLAIPIDIWAIGLCATTVFLERLRLEPPPGLGLTIWWQGALFSAIYLPLLYFIQSGTVATAKSVTAGIIEFLKEGLIPNLAIAEQISLELVMWGSVATVVLIVLALGWLFGFGWIVQRQVRQASPAVETYQKIIARWDLMRVPSDQPLLLTAFTAAGVVLIFLFWGFIPVTTPHPHDEYEYSEIQKSEERIDPAKVLQKTENVILQAQATLDELEKEKGQEKKGKGTSEKPGKASKTGEKSASGAKPGPKTAPSGSGDPQHSESGDGHEH